MEALLATAAEKEAALMQQVPCFPLVPIHDRCHQVNELREEAMANKRVQKEMESELEQESTMRENILANERKVQ